MARLPQRSSTQPLAPPNKIALENQKQGNPKSEWGIDRRRRSPTSRALRPRSARNIGQTVDFKIATDSTHYRIEIYRLGYYGGDGARKVETIDKIADDCAGPAASDRRHVARPDRLPATGRFRRAGRFPQDAVSGVYFAKLVREDGTERREHHPVHRPRRRFDQRHRLPDLRHDLAGLQCLGRRQPLLRQRSGRSERHDRLHAAELQLRPQGDRPRLGGQLQPALHHQHQPAGGTQDYIFGVEHSAIRWLEQNGYDVSYISGVDTTRNGSQLLNHEAFLSVGHDEYWSGEQRANVEAARDAGVNLAFWSGNEVYWKVRWETSIDGNGTPYRTMVCYKETWGGTPRSERHVRPAPGAIRAMPIPGQEPENSLTGTMFTVDSYRLDTITIPYDYSNLRFWRNTDVADLQPGETHSLVQNLLGYEWDSDVDNGFRPAGLINMSLSTVSVDTYLRDYGTTVGSGHGDAQPDHVSRRKRRAGVRRRHGVLVLGPRRPARRRSDARPIRTSSRRWSTCSPTWASSRRRWRQA